MAHEELPECRPDQVEVAVEWRDEDGSLSGWVEVRNVGDVACTLSNKPAVIPLAADGRPVGAETVVTLELRLPGYATLRPGQRARAPVRWTAWRGPAPGDRVLVRWPGGERQVTVTGPPAPTRADGAQTITSSWFGTAD